jgi:hypothetical protein
MSANGYENGYDTFEQLDGTTRRLVRGDITTYLSK